jgi:hypothetical protein
MDHGVQLQRQARDAREGILGGEAWWIADHHVLSADHQRVAEPQMQPPDRRKANPKQPSQGAVLGHPSRPGVPSAREARPTPSADSHTSTRMRQAPGQDGDQGRGMLRAVPIACLLLFSGICLARLATGGFPGAFDELEHISYAAHLQETGRLLPRFEEQKTLSPGDMGRWDDRPNYLGHPSPFYVLMALVLDRTLPPRQAIGSVRSRAKGPLRRNIGARCRFLT